jgi:hypothetical protein
MCIDQSDFLRIVLLTPIFISTNPGRCRGSPGGTWTSAITGSRARKNGEIRYIQSVSAKTFERNISVICQRIFMKFKMQINAETPCISLRAVVVKNLSISYILLLITRLLYFHYSFIDCYIFIIVVS